MTTPGDPEDVLIEPVAESLAEGVPVDWEAVESSALTASHRAVLRELRAISKVVDAHRRLTSADETGEAVDGALLRSWGPLIVREYVGRGSFGDVYRAWDPRLDREVALKLLTPAASDVESGRDVIAEGRVLARVRHPNVVTVYGADRIGSRVGVWMEFIEGRTLAERVRQQGPLDTTEAVRIASDVARALGAVHRAGLLHRDIKCQDVMCEASGRVVLTDFGTATALEDVESEPGATLAGTPLYLAPELLDGGAPSVQTDLYALGTLLFHVLTGSFPAVGRSVGELRARHRGGQRTSLRALRPVLPPALHAIVERALSPDPRSRFETAEEMAAALDRVLPAGATRQGAVSARRRAGVVGVLALLAAVIVAVAARSWWVMDGRSSRPVADGPADLVLVTSIENRTGNAAAGPVVQAALEDGVARATGFAVASRDRVQRTARLMRRPADARLDADAARELALRDGGIRAVVTGRIEQTGTEERVDVRVVAPASGAVVRLISQTTASADQWRERSEALAGAVAAGLVEVRDSLPHPETRYERVTTSSLAALDAFTEGRQLFEDAQWGAAGAAFRRAIDLDAEFGVAHTWLGWSLQSTSYFAEHFARGTELTRAASMEERLWAEGSELHKTGRLAEARDRFRALLRLDPLHFWALSNLENFEAALFGSVETVVSDWERQALAKPNDLSTQFRTGRALLMYPPTVRQAREYLERAGRLAASSTDSERSGTVLAYVRLSPVYEIWAWGCGFRKF